mgnify:CR=1 FL=1
MAETYDGFMPLFASKAAREPARRFATFEGQPFTYGDLDRWSGSLAHRLADTGVAPGDRVALMLRNSPLALAALFAIGKAGAVWVPVNTESVGDNLAYILDHARPRLLIADGDLLATIAACGSALAPDRIADARDAERAMQADPARGFDPPAIDPDQPYAIMYTSGTTGRPKGVLVSHRMLRLSGEAAGLVSGARPGDVMHMWEPLSHIGGAQMIVLPLIRDVSLAMVARFSAGRFWQQVNAAGASHIHFLGGILQILLKQPPGPLDRTHGARTAWGGGCPSEVWRPFEQRFGVAIRECYGMTECSSVTTANLDGTLGSVGRPMPWFDVTIRRPDGTPVDGGERGEIVVTTSLSGAMTKGYLDDPAATAKALRAGAFYTGDYGSRDSQGNMSFHGRMSDSARVKGQNVSALEVESVAGKHPDVEDCAMIAVAADVGEQDIKLFVKPRAGAAITPNELSDWLEPRLAPYQRPRYVMIVAEFERTPSLRIMKHRLSTRTDDAWDRLQHG